METLVRFEVNEKFLPLSPENRKWLIMALNTISAELEKGEHANMAFADIPEWLSMRTILEREGRFKLDA